MSKLANSNTRSITAMFERLAEEHHQKMKNFDHEHQPKPPKPKPRKYTEPEPRVVAPPAPSRSPKSTLPTVPASSKAQPPKAQPKKQIEVEDKWKINFQDLEIEEMISSGEGGEVYLGYFFGTPVAIKKLFIDPSETHLMEKEYLMLKEVSHPNLVQFLGLCIHETGVYLVTEYVEHGDLFDRILFADQPLSWKEKVRIALQVAQAVFYLHSRNIIHRDLKSLNILLGESNKVKVCDLGLATQMENKNFRTTFCGTDQWMAPEIFLGEPYDFSVDVFGFGLVLTELITDQPPQKRNILTGFAFDHQAFLASVSPECPPEFAQLAVECTQYEPKDRPNFKQILSKLRPLSQKYA